jgi:hypothetical protein
VTAMMSNCFGLSPRLVILWKQSHIEAGFSEDEIPDHAEKPRICLFPWSFVEQVEALPHAKIYDFNFVGAVYVDEKTRKNRQWLFDFAKCHFTSQSIFQVTDRNARQRERFWRRRHRRLGAFDRTFSHSGFVPKECPARDRGYFDPQYFTVLCQSRFTLCPAGDAPWSMRFHEAILAKSIPIVEKPEHTGRNELEYAIGYKYYLADDPEISYRPEWVEENFRKLIQFHTLPPRFDVASGATRAVSVARSEQA